MEQDFEQGTKIDVPSSSEPILLAAEKRTCSFSLLLLWRNFMSTEEELSMPSVLAQAVQVQ